MARVAGAGGADRVLFLLLLDEGRDVGGSGGGVGDAFGSIRGGRGVPVRQAFGGVAEDHQRLGDGVQGRNRQVVVEGIQADGLRRGLRRSLGNLPGGGRGDAR